MSRGLRMYGLGLRLRGLRGLRVWCQGFGV